jgi:hypothetical protein
MFHPQDITGKGIVPNFKPRAQSDGALSHFDFASALRLPRTVGGRLYALLVGQHNENLRTTYFPNKPLFPSPK